MSKKREAKTIQVFLRMRPPNAKEEKAGDNCDVVHFNHENNSVYLMEKKQNPYNFTQVFGPKSKQEDVFESVAKKAVEDAFNGYHGLLLAYGQTGTGKTFTISNKTKGQEGMLQRACKLVFGKIEDDKKGDYEVKCTFIQIYQEIIQDLLEEKKTITDEKNKGIAIRDDPDVEGRVYLHPVVQPTIYQSGDDPESGAVEALRLFHKGDNNRTVGQTDMNAVSSRSHTIFTLNITRRNKMTNEDYDEPEKVNKQETKGRLILVDLAGCERQKKTAATGQRLNEANAINNSLLVLGRCIKALTDPNQHVPYRESKLTRLLQYSLAGHGKTSIVVTCGPSETNLDETRSAIEFGQRAMTIKQHAKLHVEIDYKALCKKLQAQLDERGDAANQDLLDEVRADYEEQIAKRDVRIRVLEVEVEELRGGASPREGSPAPSRSGGGSSGTSSSRDKDKDRKSSRKDGKESKESRSRRSDKESDRDRDESDGGSRHRDPTDSSSRSDRDRDRDRSSKSKYKAMVKELEERLDNAGMQVAKLKKEKVGLSRNSNDLEAKLQQKTIQINLLAAKYQHMLREKEESLETMQSAILKLQKGDYISPTADLDVDDSDASPRSQGMTDNDYIQRLELVVRKFREKQSQLAAYQAKSKESIQYLHSKWEEEQEKAEIEREKRKKVEAKLERYRNK
eukprot:TRINITY_DN640_c1_g1_i1.p1 TRINITY_DN640_c1_g1~~TRINITY_DN640_c1_g1_i1.p1  ORF type:complete len:680 (+),score=170.38 TRINITY_DN640_c1_g1_i1:63-2102(+)